jgi:hypothetical protein
MTEKFDRKLVVPLEAVTYNCDVPCVLNAGHHLNRPVSRSLVPRMYTDYGRRDTHCQQSDSCEMCSETDCDGT